MTVPVVPAEGFEEHVRALGRTVVMFHATWCGYCLRFTPAFERAAARNADAALHFASADISDDDEDPRWGWYDIEVVPTVLLFEGGKVVARLDGAFGRGIKPSDLDAFVRGLRR